MKRLLCSLAAFLAAAALLSVPASAEPRAAIWKPPLNSRWQYQLSGNTAFPATGGVNVDICVAPQGGGACVRPQVFDIDLYAAREVTGDNTTLNTAAVQAIHARGAKAICYVDAGGIEKGRPDYQEFVNWHNTHGKSLIGKAYPGFPDENYANINNNKGQRDFMLQMMSARVQKCVQAGFDGVEFDVVNAYEEGQAVTGWNISAATQLTYNKALAALAHANGLSVGLKNDLSQVPQLVSYFDYAINEQCAEFDECDVLKPFTNAGKAVFQVEYEVSPANFCGKANTDNFNAIKKGADYQLNDKPYTPCR